MKYSELLKALESGKIVNWRSERYQVVKSKKYSIGIALLDKKLNIEYPLSDSYHKNLVITETKTTYEVVAD